jgi:hypothetical protein
MKKRILLLALIAAVALLFSCKKNEGSNNNRGEDYEAPPRASTGGGSSGGKQGYALKLNTGIYVLKGDDTGDESTTVTWASSLTLGDTVTIAGKPRKMTFINSNNKKEGVYNFIEVRLEDKSKGFALANQVADGGNLAVVTEEKSTLFKAANMGKITNTVIARKTVLVYYPETAKSGFVEVKGIDCENGNPIPDKYFLRSASLSMKDSDIQSSILFQIAKPMTSDNQTIAREALLKSALQDYPDSVFAKEIRSLLPDGGGVSNEGYFDDDGYGY